MPARSPGAGSPLTKVAAVTVLAADPATRAVTALDITPEAVVAGTTLAGTVTLNNPAPSGGVSVGLWSNTSYGPGVRVPPYVLVEAGQTTATFPIEVTSVEAPAVVTPSADIGTTRVTDDLLVVPAAFAVGYGVSGPGTVTEVAVGIGSAPNATGTTLTLSSDTPGITVPSTVTVPAGSPGAVFQAVVAASVPRGTLARITATWNGVSVSGLFFV